MLKNTPRLITIGLILLFSLPIAIQHGKYIVLQLTDVSGNANGDAIKQRRAFEEKIETYTRALTFLDHVDYDFHLSRGTDSIQIHPDVTVVEIGESSLKKIGQYPFSRMIYRQLLERLEKAGAKVVAFDVVFPEQDSSIELMTELRRLRHEIEQKEGFDSQAVKEIDTRIFAIDADEDFATALARTSLPVVLGYTFANDVTDPEKIPPEAKNAFTQYDLHRRNYLMNGALYTRTWYRPVISLEKILSSLNAKSSIGHFNPDSDSDGMIRRVPAVLEFNGRVLGALALRAVAAYYGERPVLDGTDGLTVRGVRDQPDGGEAPGQLYFPVSSSGNFLLRFYGAGRTFPFTEFGNIVSNVPNDPERLSDEKLRELFAGKIVFIGVTAQGLKDLRATPFDPEYPGVETHATLASNVLSQTFLVQDWRFYMAGYFFCALFGGLVSWAVFRFHPFHALSVALASVLSIQLLTQYAFFNHGVVAPSFLPSAVCLAVFFSGVLYRYFTEEREKRATRAAFSRYVSSAVVEEILKDQTKLRLGGQKKELTVMFVDLVNFTKMSEHMDAAFVTQLLNEYFTRMTNILLVNKGTLDKYMGDAMMCFWGAPLENADHARLACRTALEMRAELERINRDWKLRHGITIENRIGVHTGVTAVGNMGSDQVFSYTCMGDNVNLASRIERVNTVYGTSIVVSAATAAKAGSGFLFRPLDRVQVKGRDDAVDILELVSEFPASRPGEKSEKEPEWVHAFRSGLAHYQAGEWDDAESAFGACLTLKPGDGPSTVFIDRIRDFRILAPDEWSGVWKLSSK
jgi:adenylate cyclase